MFTISERRLNAEHKYLINHRCEKKFLILFLNRSTKYCLFQNTILFSNFKRTTNYEFSRCSSHMHLDIRSDCLINFINKPQSNVLWVKYWKPLTIINYHFNIKWTKNLSAEKLLLGPSSSVGLTEVGFCMFLAVSAAGSIHRVSASTCLLFSIGKQLNPT